MENENNQIPISEQSQPSSENKKINKVIKIILTIFGLITFGLLIFFAYRYYSKNYQAPKQKTEIATSTISALTDTKNAFQDLNLQTVQQFSDCPPLKTYDEITTDENPDEVAEKLYKAMRQNDYSYILPHLYCDQDCQKTMFDQLHLCYDDVNKLDEWASQRNEKVEFINFSSIALEKTATSSIYAIKYTISNIDSNGKVSQATFGGSSSMKLTKIGKRWKININDGLEYVLSAFSQDLKIYNDIKKCLSLPPVTYTSPTAGGLLKIDDSNNPLNGLIIKFPKLKEPLEVEISCLDQFPKMNDSLPITLPISIKFNKSAKQLTQEQSEIRDSLTPADASSLSISEISDLYNQIKFDFVIPYYDISFNEENAYPFIGSLSDTRVLDINKNLLSAYSYSLPEIIFGTTMFDSIKPINLNQKSIVDSDNDGLADHIESIFNTDKDNPDTDSDGHFDSEEIINEYNPTGNNHISISDPATQNKILILDDQSSEASSGLTCYKIYSYDFATNNLKKLIEDSSAHFFLSPDHQKIIYDTCSVKNSGSIKTLYDINSGQKENINNQYPESDQLLWQDIWLKKDNVVQTFAENYSLILYNQKLAQKTNLESFSRTAVSYYPSKDRNYLYCSGNNNAYRLNILQDKIDKEYSFNSPVMYFSPNTNQLFYIKANEKNLTDKIYIYNDKNDTSTRLTDLDDSYQETISWHLQENKKLLFNVIHISQEKSIDQNMYNEYQLGIYDPKTGKLNYIKEKGMPLDNFQLMKIIISPDGQNIAYYDNIKQKVVIYNLDKKSFTKEIDVPTAPSEMIWY